jgi:hypothetical protein
VEEVDNVRTRAEENINALLENFMGINDAELGRNQCEVLVIKVHLFESNACVQVKKYSTILIYFGNIVAKN